MSGTAPSVRRTDFYPYVIEETDAIVKTARHMAGSVTTGITLKIPVDQLAWVKEVLKDTSAILDKRKKAGRKINNVYQSDIVAYGLALAYIQIQRSGGVFMEGNDDEE